MSAELSWLNVGHDDVAHTITFSGTAGAIGTNQFSVFVTDALGATISIPVNVVVTSATSTGEGPIQFLSWTASAAVTAPWTYTVTVGMVAKGGDGFPSVNIPGQPSPGCANIECDDPITGVRTATISFLVDGSFFLSAVGDVRRYQVAIPMLTNQPTPASVCYPYALTVAGLDGSTQSFPTIADVQAAGFYLTFDLPAYP